MKESASSPNRIAWLDITRLLAMAMVAIQHWLSVCDINPSHIFFNLDPGQFGVSMFFSISGFFVVQGRTTKVGPWLIKRLSRIFVPYWIALTGVLLANHFWSYKSVSLSLIVSEYLGLAGWTHRGELVGVHFWFVSLLLFCYAIGAIVRSFSRVLPVIIGATIAWLWFNPHYAGHTLAFLTGVYFGRFGRQPPVVGLVAVSVCAVALALSVHVGFACIAVGAMVIASTAIPIRVSDGTTHALSKASELSYHFYLVHGPIYLAVARLLSESIMTVLVLGTLGSGLAAIMLQRMESASRRLPFWFIRILRIQV